MGPEIRWTNEEWRRLQTSLFAVTGTTRIKLSALTSQQWAQVVKDTRRSRADIDAALEAMLKRQNLPGGRVPVQTTERLFRESAPLLKGILLGRKVPLPEGGKVRVEKILNAVAEFNFASLPYEDLFFAWDVLGRSEGKMEHHECLRCVYSVLGQITQTQVSRLKDDMQQKHAAAMAVHRHLNPRGVGGRR
eukprot:CAMPEP_0181325608 /NCGR_PEP_ID=MMETSP1101-20121128/21026_1 /TAXON_ID=46948 /ORGANISM="Rhodomonas abbreviata, Strain Caron Lab Isolate" /LENGTH=190 /DNA_ID=CAMNT_0023433947 /DNA_START=319 /DNA_END=888 /DNA_ORIENTATION=-